MTAKIKQNKVKLFKSIKEAIALSPNKFIGDQKQNFMILGKREKSALQEIINTYEDCLKKVNFKQKLYLESLLNLKNIGFAEHTLEYIRSFAEGAEIKYSRVLKMVKLFNFLPTLSSEYHPFLSFFIRKLIKIQGNDLTVMCSCDLFLSSESLASIELVQSQKLIQIFYLKGMPFHPLAFKSDHIYVPIVLSERVQLKNESSLKRINQFDFFFQLLGLHSAKEKVNKHYLQNHAPIGNFQIYIKRGDVSEILSVKDESFNLKRIHPSKTLEEHIGHQQIFHGEEFEHHNPFICSQNKFFSLNTFVLEKSFQSIHFISPSHLHAHFQQIRSALKSFEIEKILHAIQLQSDFFHEHQHELNLLKLIVMYLTTDDPRVYSYLLNQFEHLKTNCQRESIQKQCELFSLRIKKILKLEVPVKRLESQTLLSYYYNVDLALTGPEIIARKSQIFIHPDSFEVMYGANQN